MTQYACEYCGLLVSKEEGKRMIQVNKIGEYVWELTQGEFKRRVYGLFENEGDVIHFAWLHNYFNLAPIPTLGG